jgi:hypothetical protein
MKRRQKNSPQRTWSYPALAVKILVDKAKFDRLLVKMLNSPPLPKSQVKVANPKPKKSLSR